MKSKSLCLADGVYGLVAGIILLIGPIIITTSAVSDVANETSSSTAGASGFLTLLKIVAIALGILSLVFYKGTTLMKPAASVLLIVGGAVALIPFLGWAGGIVVIVGGGVALANLKNFTPKQPLQ